MTEMTDREKHLRLALDALAILDEDLREFAHAHPRLDEWQKLVFIATEQVAEAAMPKPGIIRRLFTRREAAA
jgi:hypothetical protein